MEDEMLRRSITALTTALLLTTGSADAQKTAEIMRYPLPAEVTYPEGIAYDARQGAIYTGSALTGAVVRLTLASKETTVVSPAGALLPAEPFPALLGMKIDARDRLWVAGG